MWLKFCNLFTITEDRGGLLCMDPTVNLLKDTCRGDLKREGPLHYLQYRIFYTHFLQCSPDDDLRFLVCVNITCIPDIVM